MPELTTLCIIPTSAAVTAANSFWRELINITGLNGQFMTWLHKTQRPGVCFMHACGQWDMNMNGWGENYFK